MLVPATGFAAEAPCLVGRHARPVVPVPEPLTGIRRLASVNLLGRLFGSRKHAWHAPTRDEVAAVDVGAMIATARRRGDVRSEPEVVASLVLGAELTAERHPEAEMRQRAAAASVAATDWLVERVGEDGAARLVAASAGPIDAQGRIAG